MDPRAELIAQRIAEMVADLPSSVAEELAGHLQSLGATTGDRVGTDPTPPGFPADCRDGVDALVATWRSSGNPVSAHALGLAISSASRAVEAERLGERVELVWSGPAKPGTSLRRTEQALTELVQGARNEPVLRLNGIVLPLGALDLVARLLQAQCPLAMLLRPLQLDVFG